MIGCDQAEDITLPTFGLLEDILLKDDSAAESEFIFVFSMSKTTRFDHHLAAYEIERIPNSYQCSYAVSLKCHYLFSSVVIGQHTYIKSKYDLSGYF